MQPNMSVNDGHTSAAINYNDIFYHFIGLKSTLKRKN